MDTKLLLVKCITLLYLQSLLTDKSHHATESVIKKVLEHVKPADKSITTDFGHDTISKLRETVVWMLQRVASEPFTVNDLKQRFILTTQDETYILNALTSMFIEGEIDEAAINKDIKSNIYDINTFLNELVIADILKDYYKKTQFNRETVDWENLANDLNSAILPYTRTGSGGGMATKHPSIVTSINFNEVVDIEKALQRSKDELSSLGAIKLPFQGWNRLLGTQRGLRRGEFGVWAALQHNYKSGSLLDVFIGCATLNTPYMRDPTKKPLNIRISFENPAEMDIKLMYERMHEQEFGVRVDMEALSIEEASSYVFSKLSVNGYTNELYYIDPSDFTILDLIGFLEEKMEAGYEIHLLTLDYLSLMSKKYLQQGATGEDIRDLYRRARNFTSKHGIACLTAHQLSSDAKNLVRNGASNFLELIANKGYYDGCKRLDQEVDLEIYQHIEKVNGESYLTTKRGKHRGVRTPVIDQFTVYKFDEIRGLLYDLNTEDLSRRTVGGGTAAEGNSDPWYHGV